MIIIIIIRTIVISLLLYFIYFSVINWFLYLLFDWLNSFVFVDFYYYDWICSECLFLNFYDCIYIHHFNVFQTHSQKR